MIRPERSLRLDKTNAKWLGVCAGLANYLEVEVWTVRLVFLGCIMFGAWFLVPIYFFVWWLLDEKSNTFRHGFLENQTVKHFRSVDYRKKLYRNTRDGKLWGVCAGIADYLEISIFTVRIVFLCLTFLTFFPVLFYVGAMLVLEKRVPDDEYFQRSIRVWEGEFARTEATDTRAQSFTSEPSAAAGASAAGRGGRAQGAGPSRDHFSKRREFQYCARRFANLQKRLARLEAYVTSNHFKLHREFRNMS